MVTVGSESSWSGELALVERELAHRGAAPGLYSRGVVTQE